MRVRLLYVCCVVMMMWGMIGCATSKDYSPSGPSAPAAYQGANGLYGGASSGRMQQSYDDDSNLRMEGESVQTVAMAPGVSRSSGAAAPMTDAQKVEAQRSGADNSKPNPDRKLIRNAWMTIEVDDEDDFPEHVKTFHKVAESLEGYVQSESSSTITMMVPTERLDEALKIVAKEGKVTYRNISVVDATSSYVDMKIRIENLRKMRVRLTELVNQSTSVKEVLEVERELARVTTELERIEGQMRLLSKQTSYATVNLTLEERVKPGPLGWVFYGIGKGVKWLFIRN